MGVSEPTGEHAKIHHRRKRLAWLTHEQIVELLADCKRRYRILALVVKICLSTGARWREAVNLTRSQVTKYRITFVRTKGKKNRSIPISKELYEEIMALDEFQSSSTDCYFQFYLMEKTSIVLPRGQLTTSCAIRLRAVPHDVGWKHSGLTKNSRTPRYKNDYALRTSGTVLSGNGAPFQSSGNAAKWRQSGGGGWHDPCNNHH